MFHCPANLGIESPALPRPLPIFADKSPPQAMHHMDSESDIIKLRITLDVQEDIFRDIEIQKDAPLMHLHLATLDAFGWDATEMASFYRSNATRDRGEEIPLMAMPDFDAMPDLEDEGEEVGARESSDEAKQAPSMDNTAVGDLLSNLTDRLVYVFDFLRMWCFYVEPLELMQAEEGAAYPRLIHESGNAPHPLSREVGGLEELKELGLEHLSVEALMEEAKRTDEPAGSISTGDPELDAYLAESENDDDDSSNGPNFTSLDELDDRY